MNATVLFDFDGVLVDTIEIFSEAVNVACSELGYPADFTSNHLRDIQQMSIAEIVDAARIDPDITGDFIARIDQALLQRVHRIQMFEHMADVVVHVSKFAKLGIVSATSVSVIHQVLANHGLSAYFDDVVGGDMPGTKVAKIRTIIRKNRSLNQHACMIGDTVSDVEQGKEAGVKTIAVSWGWHVLEKIRSTCPNAEARQPQDIVSIVHRLVLPSERKHADSDNKTRRLFP